MGTTYDVSWCKSMFVAIEFAMGWTIFTVISIEEKRSWQTGMWKYTEIEQTGSMPITYLPAPFEEDRNPSKPFNTFPDWLESCKYVVSKSYNCKQIPRSRMSPHAESCASYHVYHFNVWQRSLMLIVPFHVSDSSREIIVYIPAVMRTDQVNEGEPGPPTRTYQNTWSNKVPKRHPLLTNFEKRTHDPHPTSGVLVEVAYSIDLATYLFFDNTKLFLELILLVNQQRKRLLRSARRPLSRHLLTSSQRTPLHQTLMGFKAYSQGNDKMCQETSSSSQARSFVIAPTPISPLNLTALWIYCYL